MSITTQSKLPSRGDVWWVSFDSSLGAEIRKTRPAVIISKDVANRELNRVQVIPLTSRIDRLYPSEAYVPLQGQQRKAMADQIATISKQRLQNRLGRLEARDLRAIERVIRLQLGF